LEPQALIDRDAIWIFAGIIFYVSAVKAIPEYA